MDHLPHPAIATNTQYQIQQDESLSSFTAYAIGVTVQGKTSQGSVAEG